MNRLVRQAAPAALLLLSACASRTPVALAPLPDRPWTVLVGDEVRVRVYREPELNGQWVVNSRGEIVLPGLGRMAVAGLTVDSLTQLISGGYSRRIIDAVVDVGIVRNLPVLGEVRSPGVYQVEPTMTVQLLVAKAGGLRTTSLRSPTIMLQKGRDGTKYALSVDQRLDRVPVDEGDAVLVVDPNSWDRRIDAIVRYGGLMSLLIQVVMFTRR
jgi:polysaccharide export outer membrane protein